ncbi:hypothetical protein ACX0G9_26960 [Flavitalea flava]
MYTDSATTNPSMIKAAWWTGASWLIALCVMEILLSLIYLGVHRRNNGQENNQLDAAQLKVLNSLMAIYPDAQSPTALLIDYRKDSTKFLPDSTQPGKMRSVNVTADDTKKARFNDSIIALRKKRSQMIIRFLHSEFQNKTDSAQLAEIDSSMCELNTRDAGLYIADKKIFMASYFWLCGPKLYWEAFLWSLIGVITSLIYYVSLANQLKLKNAEKDDIGPFDTSEIAPQVAKMFYAPVITLVIVLGYGYFTEKSGNFINISVNHGLIVFSFMAGFYSGRLMKLLDSVKKVIFPDSSNGGAMPKQTDITLQLAFSDAITKSVDPPGADIIKAGLTASSVTLTDKSNPGNPLALKKSAAGQDGTYTGTNIPFGKYTLAANLSYDNNGNMVNLSASQEIEVSDTQKTFSLSLDF